MPDQKAKAILNDIGTEELAHLEMVGTIVHQLTDGVDAETLEKAGLGFAHRAASFGSVSFAVSVLPAFWSTAPAAVCRQA